jgi:hypothetical protein
MSLGILGGPPMARRGLSGEPPPDPWCWDYPGFKACHDRNWKTCDGKRYEDKLQNKIWTTPQFDDCVHVKDNMSCDCPAIAPKSGASAAPAAGSGLVMGNKTSDPRVAALQQAINAVLTKNGYAAIGTDGKLGPGTCGAAREADKFGAGLMAKYGLASVCTSFTTPVRSGGSSVSVPGGGAPLSPQADTLTVSKAGFLGMDTKMLLLLGAAAVGAYVVFGKKKPAKAA